MFRSLWIQVLAAVVLPLSLLTACADTDPVGPEATPVEAASRSGSVGTAVSRPLSQRSRGTMQPLGPCPGGVHFAALGKGVASHVGRFDISLRWCMSLATGSILGGTTTVTAANGDRIEMTLGGQAPSPTEMFMAATIVGGTGRFAGATGQLDVHVALDGAGGWTSDGTGWVAY